MSLILDALRRAEAEHARGRVPGLHTPVVADLPPAAGHGARAGLGGRSTWILLGAGALALLGLSAAGAWWLGRLGSEQPVPRPATAAVAEALPGAMPVAGPGGGPTAVPALAGGTATAGGGPGAPAVVPALPAPAATAPADATVPVPPVAGPAAAAPPAPRGETGVETWISRTPAVSAGARGAAASRPAAAAVPPARPGAASQPPSTTQALQTAAPAAGSGAASAAAAQAPALSPAATAAAAAAPGAVPWLADLPALRAQLPPLTVAGGMYSDQADQRLVIVNGQVVREGETVAPGVRLEQIRPRSAVFSHQGQRFAVPM